MHISEEGRHVDTIFVRKCLDHKVRSIADICIGAHKYSTAGNRRKQLYRNRSQRCCDSVCKSKSSCCCQKYQIGRRIIQEAGQSSGRPEHLVRLGDTKIRSYCFQKHQGRLHGDKNTDEKYCNLLDRTPGKMVPHTDPLIRCLKGQKCSCQDQDDLNDRRET